MSEGRGCGMRGGGGDGMRTWKKYFSVRSFCAYIGRCWQYRNNKNSKALSTNHSPNNFNLTGGGRFGLFDRG